MTGSGREQSFSGEFEKWASRELEASKLPVNAVSDFCTRACKKKQKQGKLLNLGHRSNVNVRAMIETSLLKVR